MSGFLDNRQPFDRVAMDNRRMQMRSQPEQPKRLRPANHGRRVRREQRTIEAMLGIYCHDHHGGDRLCDECDGLLRYARQRLDNCVFGELKQPCNQCTVHCYSKAMRPRVIEIMRYAGPRMTLRHPVLALFHMLDKLRRR
jgi:hypothetical protein